MAAGAHLSCSAIARSVGPERRIALGRCTSMHISLRKKVKYAD